MRNRLLICASLMGLILIVSAEGRAGSAKRPGAIDSESSVIAIDAEGCPSQECHPAFAIPRTQQLSEHPRSATVVILCGSVR